MVWCAGNKPWREVEEKTSLKAHKHTVGPAMLTAGLAQLLHPATTMAVAGFVKAAEVTRSNSTAWLAARTSVSTSGLMLLPAAREMVSVEPQTLHSAALPILPWVAVSNRLTQGKLASRAGVLSATVMVLPSSASLADIGLRAAGMHRPKQGTVVMPCPAVQLSTLHCVLATHCRPAGSSNGQRRSTQLWVSSRTDQ